MSGLCYRIRSVADICPLENHTWELPPSERRSRKDRCTLSQHGTSWRSWLEARLCCWKLFTLRTHLGAAAVREALQEGQVQTEPARDALARLRPGRLQRLGRGRPEVCISIGQQEDVAHAQRQQAHQPVLPCKARPTSQACVTMQRWTSSQHKQQHGADIMLQPLGGAGITLDTKDDGVQCASWLQRQVRQMRIGWGSLDSRVMWITSPVP